MDGVEFVQGRRTVLRTKDARRTRKRKTVRMI